jgi:uncharacterized protein
MLLDIFSELSIPVEIWAYGSRVKGGAHEGSDLDLIVRTRNNEKLPTEVLLELKDKIRNSNIPILVDLFDWSRLPDSFHKNIEACHEVFFSTLSYQANEPMGDYKKGEQEET